MPIYYKKGYKYQSTRKHSTTVNIYPEKDIKTEYISLTKKGRLKIERGYAWDGASGPTLDTPTSMRASMIHDALYQLMRMKLLDQKWRKAADKELEINCLDAGMWKIRARAWYIAVRKIAGFGAKPAYARKEIMAP